MEEKEFSFMFEMERVDETMGMIRIREQRRWSYLKW